MKIKQLSVAAFMLLFFFYACTKKETPPREDPVTERPPAPKTEPRTPERLSATLSGTLVKAEIEEGEAVQAVLNLSESLSRDFHLELRIAIDSDTIGAYINPEDYESRFEYSVDEGQNWTAGTDSRVTFPKRNKSLWVQLKTIDDTQLELNESFQWHIEAVADDPIKVSGDVPVMGVTVNDNEPNPYEEQLTGALYDIENKNEFKLKGLNRDAFYPKKYKAMIDEGLPEKLIAEIAALNELELPIVEFEAFFDSTGNLGGFVYNLSETSDRWVMGLNVAIAFEKFTPSGTQAQEYNANGELGYIIAHEYGHILTLNNKKQVDSRIAEADCKHLHLQEGCLEKESALNQFHELFYQRTDSLPKPSHVSDYAHTNIAEDIAESFAFYVAQQTIVPSTVESSGALQKINFVAENKDLKGLKTPVLNATHVTLPLYLSQVRGFRYNRNNRGQRIPCLGRDAVREAFFDKQKRDKTK